MFKIICLDNCGYYVLVETIEKLDYQCPECLGLAVPITGELNEEIKLLLGRPSYKRNGEETH